MSAIRLNRLILQDLAQHKLVILLLIGAMGSALAVIELTHMNRQLTISQDKLFQQRDALDMEWRNLLVEQRALSEHSRVEELAKKQLLMVRPLGQQDIVVDEP
ncbi:cell division protein FtsL [Rheinheimera sp. F8]|jgi:cell division protein FtsL|uniref:Cell division protein FtsL n=1 Tax=Rheinheimera tilapiae TaxID=875043 RepID=A0ABV6B976_9GAMM|nr:cell division protein FtsL [Rheinheimera sp. F8]ALZ75883.1 cell division protein FtsL [Rheinheimera sp. F8]MDZ7871606.1 cell division protein FtsL [Rheinheimera sp.]